MFPFHTCSHTAGESARPTRSRFSKYTTSQVETPLACSDLTNYLLRSHRISQTTTDFRRWKLEDPPKIIYISVKVSRKIKICSTCVEMVIF